MLGGLQGHGVPLPQLQHCGHDGECVIRHLEFAICLWSHAHIKHTSCPGRNGQCLLMYPSHQPQDTATRTRTCTANVGHDLRHTLALPSAHAPHRHSTWQADRQHAHHMPCDRHVPDRDRAQLMQWLSRRSCPTWSSRTPTIAPPPPQTPSSPSSSSLHWSPLAQGAGYNTAFAIQCSLAEVAGTTSIARSAPPKRPTSTMRGATLTSFVLLCA